MIDEQIDRYDKLIEMIDECIDEQIDMIDR